MTRTAGVARRQAKHGQRIIGAWWANCATAAAASWTGPPWDCWCRRRGGANPARDAHGYATASSSRRSR